VAAGAPIVFGLSEPSAAAKKSAGRNAVAAPLFEAIVPVVACVLVEGDVTVSLVAGELVVVADPVVAVGLADGLVDVEPHPASGRATAMAASAAPVAERLIGGPPAADQPLTGVVMRPVGRRRPAKLFEYDGRRRYASP
jgi:hypothetical protein